MNRAFLFLSLSCFALVVFLYSVGIRIPYVNLYLRDLQFVLILIGITIGGLSHPVWRRFSFVLSVCLIVFYSFLKMQLAYLWIIPIGLFFPYYYLRALYVRRKMYLAQINQLCMRYFLLVLACVSCLLVISVYRSIIGTYFEGDEWYRFRTYIPAMHEYPIALAGLLQTIRDPADFGFHQSYVVNTLYPIVFSLFGTNAVFYFLLSIALHAFSSFLVGLFTFKLTKNRLFAVGMVTAFALLASQSQAVSWIDAVLNTQLSLIFGILSLLFIFRFGYTNKSFDLWMSAVLLLLGLWSKETALGFVIPSILLYIVTSKKLSWRICIPYIVIFGVFLLSRYLPTMLQSVKSPFDIFSTLRDQQKRGVFLFRIWLFPLKMFSQTLIPQERFISLSVWLADMQFPYFVQEKAIRGSTYLNFIQTVVPEMLSYVFSIGGILLSWIFTPKRNRLLLVGCYISFFFACIPIVVLTLLFPWWGTVSLIDSRHFYHLSWIVLLIMILTLEGVAKRISWGRQRVIFFILVGIFAIFQSAQLQSKLQNQYQTGATRNMIAKKIVEAVGTPPNRMVVFTTSNKSFYGFAEYMLPFQTSFAHMLPILFSKELNPKGITYPREFFEKSFFDTNGLVAQGFTQRDRTAIGYYLDEKLLNRAVIDYNLVENEIFGFRFDGNSNELENVTSAVRERISNFKKSRTILNTWMTYDMSNDHLKFSIDPRWQVQKVGDLTVVFDARGKELFSLQSQLPAGRTHSQFSLKFGPSEKLRTSVRDYDFDYARIEYSFDIPNDNRLFLMAGNNVEFFVLRYTQGAPVDLFLRTFEYWDDGNDANLFRKGSV